MTTCRRVDIKALDILKASEVIAVNQDPLGVPGDRVWKLGPAEVRRSFLLTCGPFLPI